ncbi:hypothetical protein [Aquimarina mytili]|uniref:Uncharacterized protein n=1 Tax=Aquimarina mytili TaxID=874423 RepID=A0A936ZPS5_9FLAO|nr:hypothetical protein [Aquimarina mytili]MBL0682072.1 hypothetical protein [Aquimarina mytili]
MKTAIPPSSGKELKEIHLDTLEWKSSLHFIEVEIQFMNQLLNAYIFEPSTPNLFEHLQGFKEQIIIAEEEIAYIRKSINKHENQLGGLLEYHTISYDHSYYQEHELMKITVDDFYKSFRKLKADVFNYTGGILRKRCK